MLQEKKSLDVGESASLTPFNWQLHADLELREEEDHHPLRAQTLVKRRLWSSIILTWLKKMRIDDS